MTTAMCIGIKAACVLTLARVIVRLRTCLRGSPALANFAECAKRPIVARTLSGYLLGSVIWVFAPAASWAASAPGYHPTSADLAALEPNHRHQLMDTTGFGLKMDATLPALGKYADAPLIPTGLKLSVDDSWQAGLAGVALLVTGASVALRRRGRRDRVELYAQTILNTPPNEAHRQDWQEQGLPEYTVADSSVTRVPMASIRATTQAAPVQPAAVPAVPRPVLTIVERAMKRTQAQGADIQI